MAEQMTEEQLSFQEKINTGTSWTNNDTFDRNGYIIVRNICDPKELYSDPPDERGQYSYWDSNPEHFTHESVEKQVEGSTSRYGHPQYKKIYSNIRQKLERLIGRKLYNTYYYDRFYYPGQELTKHADRDACEISISVHISTNLEGDDAKWPFWIKTPDTYTDKKKTTVLVAGENHSCILKPGDGLIYKGCERPHWRDPLICPKKKLFSKETKEIYYHQIFFHYVLQDGYRAHCAWDRSR